MSEWLHRLARSRRVRTCTLGGLAILLMGSAGGQMLASYTVTGMDPLYVRSTPPRLASADEEQGLVRDLKLEDWGAEIPESGSPEGGTAEYSQASY